MDERLREMSFGEWDGMPIANVWRDYHAAATAWFDDPEANTPPHGEPLSAVSERADAALRDCLHEYRGQHLLLVTHGGLMRVLIGAALTMPPAAVNRIDMPWACLSRLAFTHANNGDLPRLLGHNMAGA